MTKDMIVKAAQEAAARRNEVFALNDLRVDLTARRVWKNGKPVRPDLLCLALYGHRHAGKGIFSLHGGEGNIFVSF